MQLDGSFTLAKLRPIKHFQAQVNDCSVQTVEFMSELKTMARCLLATAAIQSEKQFPENLVRTLRVGIGKRGAPHRPQPHMLKLVKAGIKGGYQIS